MIQKSGRRFSERIMLNQESSARVAPKSSLRRADAACPTFCHPSSPERGVVYAHADHGAERIEAVLASPVAWRPLLDERVQSFLTIFSGRDKSKALCGVLDGTAEIGI